MRIERPLCIYWIIKLNKIAPTDMIQALCFHCQHDTVKNVPLTIPRCWESRWVTLSWLPRDMMLFVPHPCAPHQPSRRRNLCQGSTDKSNKLPLKDVKRYIKTCGLLVGHWGNFPGVSLAVKGAVPRPWWQDTLMCRVGCLALGLTLPTFPLLAISKLQ